MKKKTKILFASLLLGASFATVATGCKGLKGDYELTNFTVDASNVTLSYEIGDTVDLSGLVMKATFSDDETKTVALTDVKIYLGNEDITSNLSKITESAGNKQLKIVYTSEYGEKSKMLTITVNAEQIVLDAIDTFNKPAFLVAYKDQLDKASNDKNSTASEAVFFKNNMDEYYIVGDDNAFKVLPVAEALDFDTGDITSLTNVTVNSTVKVLVDNAYQTLTKSNKEGAEYTYEYYQGETLLLTEVASKNEFYFAPSAVGKIFNISILPDATVYDVDSDTDAIVLPVQVVDGYNVYNTKQLAVLDNSARQSWLEKKSQAGVAGVNTNGVVLHSTMALTVEDIPDDYYYTLPDNYNVKYVENGVSKTPEEWGMTRTFLKQHYDNYATNPEQDPYGCEDYVFIYQRIIGAGQTFNFYGNYFEVDASAIPLVCAFKADRDTNGNTYVNIDGKDSHYDTYYGDDFSNAVLFHVIGQVQTWTCGNGHTTASEEPLAVCPETGCGEAVTGSEEGETFFFDNLAIKGNAQSKQLIVDVQNTENAVKDCLVYAGSIILTRLNNGKAKLDNVRNYNFFIPFMASKGTEIEYNRTKCYDSFQNAIFVWGNSNVKVNNSIFKRAGGPLVILNHDFPDDSDESLAIPHMTISSDSVMYSALTGTELWFKSVDATAIMPKFIVMDALFAMGGKTIYNGRKASEVLSATPTIGDGKMNIVALLMRDATGATEAIASTIAQGSLFYGDDLTDTNAPRLDRMTDSVLGQTIRALLNPTGTDDIDKLPPVFNIGNQVFFFDGTTIRDTSMVDATNAFKSAVSTANYVSVNQGGISILFELSPLVMDVQP